MFTMATIVAVLINFFDPQIAKSTNKLQTIVFMFTLITIVVIILEKLSIIEWIK